MFQVCHLEARRTGKIAISSDQLPTAQPSSPNQHLSLLFKSLPLSCASPLRWPLCLDPTPIAISASQPGYTCHHHSPQGSMPIYPQEDTTGLAVGESGTIGFGVQRWGRGENTFQGTAMFNCISTHPGVSGRGLVTPTQASANRGLSPCAAITQHQGSARPDLHPLRAWRTGKIPRNLFQRGTELKPS